MRIIVIPNEDEDILHLELRYKSEEWRLVENIYKGLNMTRSYCDDCYYKSFYSYFDRLSPSYVLDRVKSFIEGRREFNIIDNLYRPAIFSNTINLAAVRAIPTCSDDCVVSFEYEINDMIYIPILYQIPKVFYAFLKVLTEHLKTPADMRRFVISIAPAR
jgi:hypothetical protein